MERSKKIDIYSTRERIRKENINFMNLPLRVTFYARVSTDFNVQLNSLDNQITYYTDFIRKNLNWEYVDGYVDEGSELRLTIMSSMAQDESRKISTRVRFGHQQAIKKGTVLGTNNMYGYIKKDGKLMIDETQYGFKPPIL